MIKINKKICDVCGSCISVCPTSALLLTKIELKVLDSRCDDCNICIPVCPVAALSPHKEK